MIRKIQRNRPSGRATGENGPRPIDDHRREVLVIPCQIVIEIKDGSYGERGFTCRDLEWRLWNFGTYDS
jgi:hypothetical protein